MQPTWITHTGPWTTVANTLSVPFGYYYGTHIIFHIIEKNMCHTLLTVMFNWRKPMYYQGNSRAFDLDVYAFWGRHKI